MKEKDHCSVTRREVLGGLAVTASAAFLPHAAKAAESSLGGANDQVRTVLESLVRDTPEIGVQVAAYLERQARHRRMGRRSGSRNEEARGWRHAVHALFDHERRHRHLHARLRREAQAQLRHAHREGVARIRSTGQAGRNASHGDGASDRCAANARRLHARVVAGLGPHVQGHRRTQADVPRRSAHGLPLAELRLHRWRNPAPGRWPHHRRSSCRTRSANP